MPDVKVVVDTDALAERVLAWMAGTDHAPTVIEVPLIVEGDTILAAVGGVLVWRDGNNAWACVCGPGERGAGARLVAHWEP